MNSVLYRSLTVMIVLASVHAYATDDAYLKMLEGEAETLELDPSGQLRNDAVEQTVRKKKQRKQLPGFGWSGTLDGDNLPRGLRQDEFEAVLQQNFYGTFLFYKRLNSTDKHTVYYRYSKAESTNLENVRKNILNLIKR